MPVKHRTYTLGCDPEVFVVNQSGAFVSAHDMIPGAKAAPFIVPKGAVQPDGTAAEFNIEPATTAEEFSDNIREVLSTLSLMVKDCGDYSLRVVPTAVFEEHYFKNLPATALAFGCEPDFDAYLGKVNIFKGTKEPFRTGAGHLHIGWTEGEQLTDTAHLFDCREAVKQLDSILFPLSLLWDADEKRRSLYGKLGSFRPKHYGVEYRPLSNVWVADPKLHTWIFKTTMRLMELLDEAGIKTFQNHRVAQFMAEYEDSIKLRAPLTRRELSNFHDFVTDRYNLPRLPDAYLHAA